VAERVARVVRACLALGLAVLAACGEGPSERPPGPAERQPQQILENFSLRHLSTEGTLWVLDATKGESYGPGDPIELTEMRVRFYDGAAAVRSTLTSRRGSVQETTQALVAIDSVVVATPDGDTLRTDSLRWDPRSRRIRTDIFFTLTRGRDQMTGVGLEADPDLTHYRVDREVRAVLRNEPGTNPLEMLDGGDARTR
jgi:LPS export ABC transporter protein LptC